MSSWKNKFAVITVLFLTLTSLADVTTEAAHTVDLRQDNNLKAFFDGGLRPWRLPGLENYTCVLMNEDFRILLPGNTSVRLQPEMVQISVLAKNEIDRIDITYHTKPRLEADKDMKQICHDLQLPTDGSNNITGRDRDGDWGAIKVINDRLSVHVGLQTAPTLTVNNAMLWVVIEWKYPDASMKFLTGPIQPPPGYENVSMDEPARVSRLPIPLSRIVLVEVLLGFLAILLGGVIIYARSKKKFEHTDKLV